ARFEDLLDLEADRLLAGSGSQTHTGSLDAASPIAHERTATMQSDPAIESTGSEPDDADQDTPELEDESGEGDVRHERRRSMPELELSEARRVDPTTGKPVAEDDVVLTTPAPAVSEPPTYAERRPSAWFWLAIVAVVGLVVVVVVTTLT